MGKNQILTKEQKIILDEVSRNEFLQKNFYFTGGTALSFFYLQHRYSEDLDFFTNETFDTQTVFAVFDEWSKKYHFTIEPNFAEIVYILNLNFKNNTKLKTDFARYPYQSLEKRKVVDGILVDSLTDIAVNKLFTINQRANIKDYVDLYFLLRRYTVWDLIDGVRVKFKVKLEPYIIASDFTMIEGFSDMPRMIKPLTLDKLKTFFLEKAKQLGKMVTE